MNNSTPPTRRLILGSSALLGGTALITGCEGTSSPAPATGIPSPAASAPEPSGAGLPVLPAAELPVGSRRSVKLTDPDSGREPTVLVYRSTEQDVVAYSNECPHQGCAVSGDSPGEEFRCPCHGSRFALADGSVLAGPARTGLTRYAAIIRDGQVLVFLGE